MSALTSIGQGGGSASGSRVKATGTVYARPLADRFADMLNVKDFGAKADGVTNDTGAIQQAEDYADSLVAADANNPMAGQLYFPRGLYKADNIQKKRARWRATDRYSTKLKATTTASDKRYFIADAGWLTPGSQYADGPRSIHELTVDASADRSYGYVCRSYFTTVQGCNILNATNTDLLISSDAYDGTPHAGTMVNNTYQDCFLGDPNGTQTALYNMRTVDTSGCVTDHHVIDSFFSGAATINCALDDTTAGWLVTGCHMYSAPVSLHAAKMVTGTRISDNYFEGECRFNSTIPGYGPVVIGPNNGFKDDVWANFENNGDVLDIMMFMGNNYGPGAQLIHNWFGSSKQLVSMGETFKNTVPVAHYSSGSPQGNSTGVIVLKDATIANLGWMVEGAFAGNSSSSNTHPRLPSDLTTNPRYAAKGTAGWHNKNGNLSQVKTAKVLASTNTALSLAVSIPALSDNDGFEVDVTVAQRLNHSSTVRTTFTRKYLVVKKPSDHVYYFTTVSETYSSGEWTVAPAISAADANGLCTITFTGTPATTDGYGTAILEVGGFLT